MTSITSRANSLLQHLLPILSKVGASIPIAQRDGSFVVAVDTADANGAAITRLIVTDQHRDPASLADELAPIGSTSFFANCSRESLERYLAATDLPLPASYNALEPGEVRVILFVIGGYHIGVFRPFTTTPGVA